MTSSQKTDFRTGSVFLILNGGRPAFAGGPRRKEWFFDMENKSLPKISYTAAMNELAINLAVHATSTGVTAERALDDAFVSVWRAAHASAYNKLLAGPGARLAQQVSEDIAQSTALRMEQCRTRIVRKLPTLLAEVQRKQYFGKTIRFMNASTMRDMLRRPRFESLDECAQRTNRFSETENPALVQIFLSAWTGETATSREIVESLEGLGSILGPIDQQWATQKASTQVKGWSPALEITGHAEIGDRPDEVILPLRSCQRLLEQPRKLRRERCVDTRKRNSPCGPCI